MKQNDTKLAVENLPESIAIVDVKDFFARDMKRDISSVLLQTNSSGRRAWIGYRSAQACEDALQRFNGASLHGKKLACKLEKDTSQRQSVKSGEAGKPISNRWATPATEWAPSGTIVEKDASGSVLWQAD